MMQVVVKKGIFDRMDNFLTLANIAATAFKGQAYLEPCQTSKMERFAKIVNGDKPLTIFAKRSILDV